MFEHTKNIDFCRKQGLNQNIMIEVMQEMGLDFKNDLITNEVVAKFNERVVEINKQKVEEKKQQDEKIKESMKKLIPKGKSIEVFIPIKKYTFSSNKIRFDEVDIYHNYEGSFSLSGLEIEGVTKTEVAFGKNGIGTTHYDTYIPYSHIESIDKIPIKLSKKYAVVLKTGKVYSFKFVSEAIGEEALKFLKEEKGIIINE